jgi:hypothetical protein
VTAQVLEDFFIHEHNLLEAAEQEYDLACSDYWEAVRRFDAHDPRRVAVLDAAAARRRKAWNSWWALKRGY